SDRLAVVQRLIERIGLVEPGVVPLANDPSPIENQNHGCVANGAEAMGNDDHGLADDELFQGGLNGGLAFAVEGAGGFVEDKEGGVAEEGAGDGDALLLSAGELRTALADDRVVTLRQQVHDEIVG